MDVALARRNGAGGWDPLPIPDANGPPVACAEGQTLRLTVRAGATPGVHMGGPDLAPSSLTLRDGAVEAVFDIDIHSWAGRSRLTIQAGDHERTLLLDICPHPGKLGLDAFTDLLMELSERSAAMAWGMSPGRQAGRLAGPTAAAAFPAVLDALMPELLRQVRRFLRDPPLSVQRRRDLAPLSMGRRLDTQTMRWLANHPRALSALRPGDRVVGERASSLPQVDQPVARATHDHPVTRHLLHQLHRVGRAVDATIRRLERLANNGHWGVDPYARAAAGRLSAGCHRHRAALDDALAAPTFRACRPEAAGEGALQALPDMPAAAAVQRLSRHLLTAGLDLDAESRLEAAVKRTYDLYEVVVLYRIAAAVQSLLGDGWEAHWTDNPAGEHAERPEASVVWRRGDGSPGCVRLLYQQTFQAPSASGSRREWSSLSGERRPDYILSFESLGGEDVWVILDAKYRSSRTSIHEALADLHVYRDALRHRKRKAAMAFIIVPALDPNAAVYAAADYVGAHAFGAIISAQGHDSVAAALQVLTDCVIGAAPLCPPSSPR